MKKKKEITLELVNDIPSLIRMQEFSLREMRKTIHNEQIINYQEDVLKILKAFNQMEVIKLDAN